MEKLKRHDDLKVAVQVDGEPFILTGEGILFEYVDDNKVLVYIKGKENKKEIKIRIEKE